MRILNVYLLYPSSFALVLSSFLSQQVARINKLFSPGDFKSTLDLTLNPQSTQEGSDDKHISTFLTEHGTDEGRSDNTLNISAIVK